MLTNISPREVAQKLQEGTIRLIDIRETDEYLRSSVPQAENIPLSIINKHPANISEKSLVFTCQSGNRTTKNAQLLSTFAQGEAQVMEGGMNAWNKDTLPLLKSCSGPSIFRQIQIAAGLLIVLSFIASLIWSTALWLALFVGVGLIFAGVTGFCTMGILLEKMPWNKNGNCTLIK